MEFNGLRVIAPSLAPDAPWSESDVLGACVWLWGHHDDYRQSSVESALEVLLPLIRSGNFCLFIRNGRPIGYMNWVYLNVEDEQDYLAQKKPYVHFLKAGQNASPNSRLWVMSWFFPRGGGLAARRILRKHLFNRSIGYFAYHKPHGESVPSVRIRRIQGYDA